MENKNNSLVIILMGVIIVILAVLCVLFATNTISLNSRNVNNENQYSNTNEENNNSNINDDNTTGGDKNKAENNSKVVGYYQLIQEVAQNYFVIYEFKLNSDNTVNYVIGGSNTVNHSDANPVMIYSGTFIENDKDVILSISSTDSQCVDGKYACKKTITLGKSPYNTLNEYSEDSPEFSKVDKLLFIK